MVLSAEDESDFHFFQKCFKIQSCYHANVFKWVQTCLGFPVVHEIGSTSLRRDVQFSVFNLLLAHKCLHPLVSQSNSGETRYNWNIT